MDIKNSLEIIKAIELLGVEAKIISKDGVGLEDLPESIKLLKQVDVFVAAVSDAKLVIEEMKELDQSELLQLGAAAYSMIKSISEAK